MPSIYRNEYYLHLIIVTPSIRSEEDVIISSRIIKELKMSATLGQIKLISYINLLSNVTQSVVDSQVRRRRKVGTNMKVIGASIAFGCTKWWSWGRGWGVVPMGITARRIKSHFFPVIILRIRLDVEQESQQTEY